MPRALAPRSSMAMVWVTRSWEGAEDSDTAPSIAFAYRGGVKGTQQSKARALHCGVTRARPDRAGGESSDHCAAIRDFAAYEARSSSVAQPIDEIAAQCSAGMLSRCIQERTVWTDTLSVSAMASALGPSRRICE